MPRCLVILIILCGLGFHSETHAQLMFPGDFDGNGRVENYDLLYLGYAFNNIGPPREENDLPTGAGVFLAETWAQQFPNGNNYGTVDADGNGVIDLVDFSFFLQNYGAIWGPSPQETDTSPGAPGVAPSLAFSAPVDDTLQFFSGTQIALPLFLGTPGLPVTDLNGLAFRIEFDPDHFSAVQFAFADEESWLGPDLSDTASTSLAFQTYTDQGHIDVAYTRLGPNAISGEGPIGVLSFIVVEDMVDLLPDGKNSLLSHIQVTGVLAIDEEFRTMPIAWGDLPLYLLPDGTLNTPEEPTIETAIFPNPTQGQFEIRATERFTRITYMDLLGRSHPLYQGAPREQFTANLTTQPPGVYWLHIEYTDGQHQLFPLVRR